MLCALHELQSKYNQIRQEMAEKEFVLTAEQQAEFDNALHCYCCKRAFTIFCSGKMRSMYRPTMALYMMVSAVVVRW